MSVALYVIVTWLAAAPPPTPPAWLDDATPCLGMARDGSGVWVLGRVPINRTDFWDWSPIRVRERTLWLGLPGSERPAPPELRLDVTCTTHLGDSAESDEDEPSPAEDAGDHEKPAPQYDSALACRAKLRAARLGVATELARRAATADLVQCPQPIALDASRPTQITLQGRTFSAQIALSEHGLQGVDVVVDSGFARGRAVIWPSSRADLAFLAASCVAFDDDCDRPDRLVPLTVPQLARLDLAPTKASRPAGTPALGSGGAKAVGAMARALMRKAKPDGVTRDDACFGVDWSANPRAYWLDGRRGLPGYSDTPGYVGNIELWNSEDSSDIVTLARCDTPTSQPFQRCVLAAGDAVAEAKKLIADNDFTGCGERIELDKPFSLGASGTVRLTVVRRPWGAQLLWLETPSGGWRVVAELAEAEGPPPDAPPGESVGFRLESIKELRHPGGNLVIIRASDRVLFLDLGPAL